MGFLWCKMFLHNTCAPPRGLPLSSISDQTQKDCCTAQVKYIETQKFEIKRIFGGVKKNVLFFQEFLSKKKKKDSDLKKKKSWYSVNSCHFPNRERLQNTVMAMLHKCLRENKRNNKKNKEYRSIQKYEINSVRANPEWWWWI